MAEVVMEEEKGGSPPLAVVFYGEALGKEVARQLRQEQLRVRHVEEATDALPIWEKPDYVFAFEPGSETWGEARILRIKVKGRQKDDTYWLKTSASKIVRAGLATKAGEIEIAGVGEKLGGAKTKAQSVEEVLRSLSSRRKFSPSRGSLLSVVILAVVLLFLAPFFLLAGATLTGFMKVAASAEALRANQTSEALQLAKSATGSFALAREVVWPVAALSPILGGKDFTQRLTNFLGLGERSADLVSRASTLLPEAKDLMAQVLTGTGVADTGERARRMALELPVVDEDMGLVEGQLGQILTPRLVNGLSFFGISATRLRNYKAEISQARVLVGNARALLTSFENLIPVKIGEERTYLVVFQNSSELRPTGGFIGSYGLVSFAQGRMTSFKIHDIYEADGQLRGHIAPPDEILHYLGQTSWYMRDSNWAPDFPLTAKRLEWFLEKETGIKVNGVVAVNLGAVQKILQAVGPVSLPDRQEEVTATNFFEKAEFAAEINFFPGSTQKPQFLAAVASGLLAKVSEGTKLDYLAVGKAVWQALEEKDILVYFDEPDIYELVVNNDWDGRLTTNGCGEKSTNCLMLVEANLGANKANYFVKRAVQVDQIIDKAGQVEVTVTVKYRNDSPNNAWPGGNYKNYLRILVPEGTTLSSLDLGDKRTATFSSLLTAEVLQSVPADQFLVFRSLEQSLGRKGTVDPVATSYGVLVEVPVQTERTVKFAYRPSYKLDFSKTTQNFRFVLLKQPGTAKDLVDLAIDYPTFLTPVWDQQNPPPKDVSVLALPSKLVYNTDLSKDRVFEVKFRR